MDAKAVVEQQRQCIAVAVDSDCNRNAVLEMKQKNYLFRPEKEEVNLFQTHFAAEKRPWDEGYYGVPN